MAGGTAAGGRYAPRGHPPWWWMPPATTLAILITSVDRAIPPRVPPALQREFGLPDTAGAIVLGDTPGVRPGLARTRAVVVLAIVFINGATSARLVLPAWGTAGDSPFCVIYSPLLDSVLGVAATISSTLAGVMVDFFGFRVNHAVLAVPRLLAPTPVASVRETVTTGGVVPE